MSITGLELKDECVVVTGGSRGLGFGIVQALLARGAPVRRLGIHFQVVVPQQDRGRDGARSPGRHRRGSTPGPLDRGVSGRTVWRALSPRQYGEHVATLLTDARYATGVAYGVKGDVGITALDG